MAVLNDRQAEIAETLLIGEGTDFIFPAETFLGWWSAPEVRTSDTPFSATDGVLPGRDLLGKQVVTIVVRILADSEDEMGDRIDEWKSACRSTQDSMVVLRANVFGRTRRRYGRFRIPGEVTVDTWAFKGRETVGDGTASRLAASGSAQFEVFDSRTYGDDLLTCTTTREEAGSGFLVPFLVPFTLGASVGGSCQITNAGNANSPWTALLIGPLQYPEITHLQSGRRLSLNFSANGGIDLQAGETLLLDSTTKSVLLNGTADRSTQLTIDSLWWDVEPGVNDFRLAADIGTGTMTISARDAWL